MRIKFLVSVASAAFAYDYGEVAEVTDAAAREFIRHGKAVVAAPTSCPHCGHDLDTGEAAPEAAALAASGEHATLPGGRKRG